MPFFLVSYQSAEAEFLGAAIVEAPGEGFARIAAEDAGIHVHGALSVVTEVVEVPPAWVGRQLSPRDAARAVAAAKRRQPPRR
jgi:hypothetical protein